MNKRAAAACIAAGVGIGLATTALADKAVLVASKDNTLYEDPSGGRSNGVGEHLFAGRTNAGGLRRALVAFDLADAVPAGATVTSVTLQLHMSRTISGPQATSVHRVLADWGEGTSNAGGQEGTGAEATPGDATWIHTFYDDQFWAAPGGDFAPAASATTDVSGIGYYLWESEELIADVQAWVDDPASNFGWAVLGNEPAFGSAKRFDSREHGTPAVRPKLVVEFEMGPSCPPDWNNSGTLSSEDFFAFLNDFFAGNADYNNSGATTSEDFFGFLNDFFAGC